MADERLGGLDAAFLSIETKAMHLHVSAVLLLEATGECGAPALGPEQVYARIREAVASRLARAPVLRRRVIEVPFGVGRPFLVDDPEFDIGAHVRRAALPRPGTTAELERVVADVVSRPLDRSRPLWDLVVVEGLDDGRTAVVARLHHAIADGISGLGVLAALFDLDGVVADATVPDTAAAEPGAEPGAEVSGGRPVDEPSPPLPPLTGRVPTGPEVLRVVFDNVFGDVVRSARSAARGIRDIRVLVARHQDGDGALLPRPFDAPRTSVNRAISPDREVAWAELPMAVVRQLGVVLAGTVNDVVLTLVGGALRTYLAERGEVPDGSLVAMVPVSVAAQGSGAGLVAAQGTGARGPDVETGRGAAGNRVTGMLVSLATGVEDPVGRFRLVRDSARRAKLVCRDVGSAWLESWADALIPAAPATVARALSDLRLFDYLPPVCNVVVSNVPGGEDPVRLGGLRVTAIYPLGPISEGVGLNVTVLSYAGTLHVGVQSCRALVPDPRRMAYGVLGELDRLVAAVAPTEPCQKRHQAADTRSVPWWHGDVAV